MTLGQYHLLLQADVTKFCVLAGNGDGAKRLYVVTGLLSFTGEKCRNFLYVAPSNERGKC